MLQQDKPEDFVIGTGETHTIKEFIDECIPYLEKYYDTFPGGKYYANYIWKKDNQGREILWDLYRNKLVIGIDETYYRPAEVDLLLADPSKAREKLGWEPKTTFKDLVKIMMNYRFTKGKI